MPCSGNAELRLCELGEINRMTIQEIVEQALVEGYLTPMMEAEVGRICEMAAELSIEEYTALDRLMGALLTGEVTAMPRKQFVNVMEELVVSEVILCLGELESENGQIPDVGDVSAYALNRLPPLYATSEEGANYQRQYAKDELQNVIRQQVREGLKRYLERPTIPHQPFPRRDLVEQMSHLLKVSTPD